MVLAKNTVHIWEIDLEIFSSLELHVPAFLGDTEKDRAFQFRFQKDRDTFMVSRAALRILLGMYLDCSPTDLVFSYEKLGKPYLEHKIPINFNVSHAGGKILLGFGLDHPLGVDIEKINFDFDAMEIAENYFYGEEITALQALPSSRIHEGFFSLWTRKEAVIKYDGKGLSLPLDSFSVALQPIIPKNTTEVVWKPQWETENKVYALKSMEGYKAALAAHKSVKKIEVFEHRTTVSQLQDAIAKTKS